LGIKKKGHRIILLNAIKDEYFTSLTSFSNYYVSLRREEGRGRVEEVEITAVD
jgi:hypothetical protein